MDPALPSSDSDFYLVAQQQGVALDLRSQGGRFPAGFLAAQGKKRAKNAEGKYECRLCWRTWEAQGSLRRHEREVHEEPREVAQCM